MREYKITLKWICDHCEYVADLSYEANQWELDDIGHMIDCLPTGWIRNWRTQKHYHTEQCFVASMTEEELKEYEDSVWMA